MKIGKVQGRVIQEFVDGKLSLQKTARKIGTTKMGVYVRAYHYLKQKHVTTNT